VPLYSLSTASAWYYSPLTSACQCVTQEAKPFGN